MDDSQHRKPGEWPEVGERPAGRESAPAFVAADEGGVGYQEEEGRPVGDAGCDGGAVEAVVEGGGTVDEEEVEGDVEGEC